MGGLYFTGEDHVRRSGRRIFVSSDGSYRPECAFTPSEARTVAKRLVSEADAADGKASNGITLTLERGEAEALAAVLNRVGGNADTSPRGKTQAIYRRLTDAGVKVPKFKFENLAGGLWFKNYDGSGTDPLTRSYAEMFYAFMGDD